MRTRFARIVFGVCALAVYAAQADSIRGASQTAARSARDFSQERSFDRTLRFTGSGTHTLDVRAINGSIDVAGYDGAEVQLEVRKTIRAETELDLAEGDRNVVLDIADQAPTVSVIVRDKGPVCGEPSGGPSSAWWERRRYEVTFDLTIRVPRDARLRLCTVNGRDVHVRDTAGDFDVRNVNGRITLAGIRGSGRAETVNGPVTASFSGVPRDASLFKTVNGGIVVTFPAGLAADLRMKTFNGGLFTDFEVEPVPHLATAERRNGRFVYRSNQFTTVRAGGGGPELSFETLNGDIRVLRAAR